MWFINLWLIAYDLDWFGIWATLYRLELEYAGLNVGKNKFGFQFFFFFLVGLGIWATLSRLELEYASLNVGKNKFGFQFFFSFFFGPRIGLNPLTKKPCLVNELGRARGSGPGI